MRAAFVEPDDDGTARTIAFILFAFYSRTPQSSSLAESAIYSLIKFDDDGAAGVGAIDMF